MCLNYFLIFFLSSNFFCYIMLICYFLVFEKYLNLVNRTGYEDEGSFLEKFIDFAFETSGNEGEGIFSQIKSQPINFRKVSAFEN